MTEEIRRSVLDLLANADGPLTTAQINDALGLRALVGDIYSVLFPMQYQGLVECSESCPWTWSAAKGISSTVCAGN